MTQEDSRKNIDSVCATNRPLLSYYGKLKVIRSLGLHYELWVLSVTDYILVNNVFYDFVF